jgi:hypothetical protein
MNYTADQMEFADIFNTQQDYIDYLVLEHDGYMVLNALYVVNLIVEKRMNYLDASIRGI